MSTNLNQLTLMAEFATIVRASSFTLASRQLGISKSVLSRHLSRLEKELGTQLLYRSTHGLSATDAGERLYVYCKDLDDVAEQARAAAMAGQHAPRGLLRVTLPQALSVSTIGALISKFQKKYPDVHLDARVTSLQVDPIESGFDVALRIGSLGDSNLLCRKLASVKIQAVAGQEYLQRHGTPRVLDDLREHNCLIYSDYGDRERAQQVNFKLGGKKMLTVRGDFSTNSGVLLLHALLEGQGIVIGPDIMFEKYVESGEIKVIFDKCSEEVSGLYAVFPQSRFASTGRKAFVDFLLDRLGKDSRYDSIASNHR